MRIIGVKDHDYAYLVENRREEGRVRQRILRYFGRADGIDVEALRARFRAASRGPGKRAGHLGPRLKK